MRKIILITAFMSLLLFSLTFSTQIVETVYDAIKVANQDKMEWPMFRHDLRHTGCTDGLGPDNNQTRWNYSTRWADVISSPAVIGDRVYVGSWDSNLYCFDVFTGRVVWKYTTGDWIESSPAVADGRVYVGSWDDQVYCLNASNGDLIWDYTTGNDVVSSPAVSEGMVYVGSDDSFVYCLNASTGTLIWNYTTGDDVDSSPAVAGGMVYVGSEDNYVYCFNASTGDSIWRHETDDDVDSSPAVAGGAVYIGSDDGYVYCFGFRFFNVFTVFWGEETYYVATFSNSTISEPNFSQTEMQISFNVTSSTPGFCNITIPKELLNATQYDWSITVDGEPISYEVTENKTHTFLYITYDEGVHAVKIVGTWVVADFPLFMTAPLLLIVTLIAVALAKRMRDSARDFSM